MPRQSIFLMGAVSPIACIFLPNAQCSPASLRCPSLSACVLRGLSMCTCHLIEICLGFPGQEHVLLYNTLRYCFEHVLPYNTRAGQYGAPVPYTRARDSIVPHYHITRARYSSARVIRPRPPSLWISHAITRAPYRITRAQYRIISIPYNIVIRV